MNLLTLGLNHRSAPLDLRSRFAFTLDQLAPALHGFRERAHRLPAHPEVALLSTCNRTELYCAADTELLQPAVEWLASLGGVSAGEMLDHAYVFEGDAAARQAFRVASGLDSMVLGEPQILGQMKQAVREAGAAGALGTTLHQLFQRCFSVAKEVRSRTEIGAHSISMAAAAVNLATQLFGDLTKCNVLFVGAGEMIELAAAHFASRKPKTMSVANRNLERAAVLARRLGAQSIRLADLPDRLAEFDIVISGTASVLPIIGAGAVERAMRLRRKRAMLLLDLAVPRDIEAEVARLENVTLFSIDDLSDLVRCAGAKRTAAVGQAEAIIDSGVHAFMHWLDRRASVPLIRALNAQADGWREAELSRARKSIARGENVDAVLETLTKALTQKMLHGALAELHGSSSEQRDQVASTVSRLFLRCPVRSTGRAAAAPEFAAHAQPGDRIDLGTPNDGALVPYNTEQPICGNEIEEVGAYAVH